MSEPLDLIRGLVACGRTFVDGVVPILEAQRSEARTSLYDPVADEVIAGLFARTFRFLQTFVLDYHLWADDLGRVVLRLMLESVFYLDFLMDRGQPEMFVAFQKYGIGQEKLYKMQLRKLLEEGKLRDSEEIRQFIESSSDEEIADELVNVRLKNFEDLRNLATDAGMKDEYVLYYQPYSTIIHGHWPSLRRYYLETCREPLHRRHLQPTFGLPALNLDLLKHAFSLFGLAYELWRKKYGLADRVAPFVDQYFRCCNSIKASNDAKAKGASQEKGSAN